MSKLELKILQMRPMQRINFHLRSGPLAILDMKGAAKAESTSSQWSHRRRKGQVGSDPAPSYKGLKSASSTSP